MSSRAKKFAIVGLSCLALIIVVLVLVVPALVNVDRYRPQLEAELQAKTGKPVRIGHLALTLFPSVSIRVDDVEIGNPRGFPTGDFLKAKRIYAVVNGRALLSRQVNITSLDLESPELNLLCDVRGHWNYENPPAPAQAGSSGPPLFTLGIISSVTIEHGGWTMANLLPSGRSGPAFLEGQDISSQLKDVDLSAFGESTSAALFRSPASWSSASSSGWLSATVYAAESPGPLVAHGTLDAGSLSFETLRCTSLQSKIRMYAKQILLDDVALDLAGGKAAGSLALDLSGANLRYNTNVQLHDVDMTQLLQAFPQSRGKMSGTMDGTMKLAGEVTHSSDPLSGMQGSGRVSVRNGKLPSLQLNKNLMLLARLASLGPAAGDPSSFSSISADLEIAQDRIHSNKISILGNGVDVDGAGDMALAGAGNLNYTGMADLAAGQTGLTNFLGNFTGATYNNGKLSFPFDLKGTLENPRFLLSGAKGGLGGLQNLMGQRGSGSTTQSPSNSPNNLLQGITGLFGKKKKQQSTQP